MCADRDDRNRSILVLIQRHRSHRPALLQAFLAFPRPSPLRCSSSHGRNPGSQAEPGRLLDRSRSLPWSRLSPRPDVLRLLQPQGVEAADEEGRSEPFNQEPGSNNKKATRPLPTGGVSITNEIAAAGQAAAEQRGAATWRKRARGGGFCHEELRELSRTGIEESCGGKRDGAKKGYFWKDVQRFAAVHIEGRRLDWMRKSQPRTVCFCFGRTVQYPAGARLSWRSKPSEFSGPAKSSGEAKRLSLDETGRVLRPAAGPAWESFRSSWKEETAGEKLTAAANGLETRGRMARAAADRWRWSRLRRWRSFLWAF